MTNTHTLYRQREAIVNWIANDDYTHALTLNTDRELSPRQLERIFGQFCHEMDRSLLSRKNVSKAASSSRFRAIAFPENLEINAHLHAAADLSDFSCVADFEKLHSLVERCWHRSTRSAGSIELVDSFDLGWPLYMTKRFAQTEGSYFHSFDYHPR